MTLPGACTAYSAVNPLIGSTAEIPFKGALQLLAKAGIAGADGNTMKLFVSVQNGAGVV